MIRNLRFHVVKRFMGKYIHYCVATHYEHLYGRMLELNAAMILYQSFNTYH